MADFHIFTGDEVIATDLPEKLNLNFDSLKSDFAGTSFPTANLKEGMTCYRTDQKKVYRLMSNLSTWKLESDLNYDGGIPVATQSEAEAGTDNTKVMTPLRTKQSITKATDVINTSLNGKLSTTGGTLNGNSVISGNITGSEFVAEPGKGINIRCEGSGSSTATSGLQFTPTSAQIVQAVGGDLETVSSSTTGAALLLDSGIGGLLGINGGAMLANITVGDNGTSEYGYLFINYSDTTIITADGTTDGGFLMISKSPSSPILTHLGYLTTKVNGNTCSALGEITIPEATTAKSGVMSSADKTKLDKTAAYTYSTSDISVGSSLANGEIYVVYE